MSKSVRFIAFIIKWMLILTGIAKRGKNGTERDSANSESETKITSRYAEVDGVIIDPQKLPERLRPVLKYAVVWAIADDIERSRFADSVSLDEKKEFVDVVLPQLDDILDYCSGHRNETPVPDEIVLLDIMCESFAEVRYDVYPQE